MGGIKKMATKNSRGWIWSQKEKEDAKVWKTWVRNQSKKLKEQVRRFKEFVTDFAEEAANVAQDFLSAANTLLEIDVRCSGRKYQPVSLY